MCEQNNQKYRKCPTSALWFYIFGHKMRRVLDVARSWAIWHRTDILYIPDISSTGQKLNLEPIYPKNQKVTRLDYALSANPASRFRSDFLKTSVVTRAYQKPSKLGLVWFQIQTKITRFGLYWNPNWVNSVWFQNQTKPISHILGMKPNRANWLTRLGISILGFNSVSDI